TIRRHHSLNALVTSSTSTSSTSTPSADRRHLAASASMGTLPLVSPETLRAIRKYKDSKKATEKDLQKSDVAKGKKDEVIIIPDETETTSTTLDKTVPSKEVGKPVGEAKSSSESSKALPRKDLPEHSETGDRGKSTEPLMTAAEHLLV